jgi:hypothetical protein
MEEISTDRPMIIGEALKNSAIKEQYVCIVSVSTGRTGYEKNGRARGIGDNDHGATRIHREAVGSGPHVANE